MRLARLGASTGTCLALSPDGVAAADLAAEVLGELRGLAAKIGQMASYVDGMVPESHRAAYEQSLRALQAQAASSDPAAVRKMVEAELGASPEALFASFDEAPFASASIGQVHHAVLHDGREVAVKVQHPGIDRAVASDLANAGVVTSMMSTLGPRSLGVDASSPGGASPSSTTGVSSPSRSKTTVARWCSTAPRSTATKPPTRLAYAHSSARGAVPTRRRSSATSAGCSSRSSRARTASRVNTSRAWSPASRR